MYWPWLVGQSIKGNLTIKYIEMKKFTTKYLQPAALFLAVLVLFQCCKVYDRKSVSLDKAIDTDIRSIKIVLKDHRRYYFTSIYYKDDILYGELKKSRHDLDEEIKINPESIKGIYLFNKKKSSYITAIVIIVPIVLFISFSVYCFNKCGISSNCSCFD